MPLINESYFAAQADTGSPSLTAWEVAAPFAVAIMLQVIAYLVTLMIPLRVPELLKGMTHPNPPQPIGPGVTDTHISDLIGWGIDLAASFGAMIAPIAGLVLVAPAAGNAVLTVVYLGSFVLSLGLFVYIFTRKDVSRYSRPFGITLSPGFLIGLTVNGLALIIALKIYPA